MNKRFYTFQYTTGIIDLNFISYIQPIRKSGYYVNDQYYLRIISNNILVDIIGFDSYDHVMIEYNNILKMMELENAKVKT